MARSLSCSVTAISKTLTRCILIFFNGSPTFHLKFRRNFRLFCILCIPVYRKSRRIATKLLWAYLPKLYSDFQQIARRRAAKKRRGLWGKVPAQGSLCRGAGCAFRQSARCGLPSAHASCRDTGRGTRQSRCRPPHCTGCSAPRERCRSPACRSRRRCR